MLSTFHGLSEAEVESKTEVSVCEATRLQSVGDGQGFTRLKNASKINNIPIFFLHVY
jgi:hypothetical protein